MTTAAQTRAIHALKRQIAGLEEDDYRALLKRRFGLSSSRLLSERQAAELIDDLKRLAGSGCARKASETVTGDYAPVLRALWMAAHNLGLARSRDDKALIAFVARQTGLSHTRFLRDPRAAAAAIEGLKKWMERAAGVEWPTGSDNGGLKRKEAVVMAIARRCMETGAFTPFMRGKSFEEAWPLEFEAYGYRLGCPNAFAHYDAAAWDRLANALGSKLRKALAKQEEAA
jgi:hypothetical protein